MKTQLIWNGCDGYVVADDENSELPDWPVQGGDGRWYHEEFPGQRVLFEGARVHFSFEVVEIDKAGVRKDEDGELVPEDYMYVTEDGRVWQDAEDSAAA